MIRVRVDTLLEVGILTKFSMFGLVQFRITLFIRSIILAPIRPVTPGLIQDAKFAKRLIPTATAFAP